MLQHAQLVRTTVCLMKVTVLWPQGAQMIVCPSHWKVAGRVFTRDIDQAQSAELPKEQQLCRGLAFSAFRLAWEKQLRAELFLNNRDVAGWIKKECHLWWEWRTETLLRSHRSTAVGSQRRRHDENSWRCQTVYCKKKERFCRYSFHGHPQINQAHWTQSQLHAPGPWLASKKHHEQLNQVNCRS